eukprot:8310945-Ditylum_brightwellii.AAC.1
MLLIVTQFVTKWFDHLVKVRPQSILLIQHPIADECRDYCFPSKTVKGYLWKIRYKGNESLKNNETNGMMCDG